MNRRLKISKWGIGIAEKATKLEGIAGVVHVTTTTQLLMEHYEAEAEVF